LYTPVAALLVGAASGKGGTGMNKSKIEWCDMTWNPVTGCLHGCEYCYARRQVNRFGMPQYDNDCHVYTGKIKSYDDAVHTGPYPWGFAPTFHKYRLNEPQQVKKPSKIFVVSMGDLFGDWVPDEWIQEVFKACEAAPQHKYLFLTKNYLRAGKFKFHSNWWIGKTITNEKNADLCHGDPWSTDITKRANQYLSTEPIHGPIPDLPYYAHEYGFRWVIVGAETGNRKDKVIPKREWIEKIVESCKLRNVPVFMKNSLKDLMGDDFIQEWPEGLRKEMER
jgi:protein gp37